MNVKASIAAAAIGLLAITAGVAYAQAQAENCCCCEDRADCDCCDHGERHGDHGDDHQPAPQQ